MAAKTLSPAASGVAALADVTLAQHAARTAAKAQQQARVVIEHPARDDAAHRLVPHLLTDVPNHCQLMQQEIFGPLLPLIPYDDPMQVVAQINAAPKPLATQRSGVVR